MTQWNPPSPPSPARTPTPPALPPEAAVCDDDWLVGDVETEWAEKAGRLLPIGPPGSSPGSRPPATTLLRPPGGGRSPVAKVEWSLAEAAEREGPFDLPRCRGPLPTCTQLPAQTDLTPSLPPACHADGPDGPASAAGDVALSHLQRLQKFLCVGALSRPVSRTQPLVLLLCALRRCAGVMAPRDPPSSTGRKHSIR